MPVIPEHFIETVMRGESFVIDDVIRASWKPNDRLIVNSTAGGFNLRVTPASRDNVLKNLTKIVNALNSKTE